MGRSKILATLCLAFIALASPGCVSNMFPGGPTPAGLVYTEVTAPAQYVSIALDPSAKPLKTGQATASAFLGIFAFGDAGLEAAMRDGGITRVHHVDHEVQHFLYAAYLKTTTIVYGE